MVGPPVLQGRMGARLAAPPWAPSPEVASSAPTPLQVPRWGTLSNVGGCAESVRMRARVRAHGVRAGVCLNPPFPCPNAVQVERRAAEV